MKKLAIVAVSLIALVAFSTPALADSSTANASVDNVNASVVVSFPEGTSHTTSENTNHNTNESTVTSTVTSDNHNVNESTVTSDNHNVNESTVTSDNHNTNESTVTSDNHNTNESTVTSDNHNVTESTGRGYRGFAEGSGVPIPAQGPAYFGKATPGSLFQSLKTILIYKDTYTIEEIALMTKSAAVKVIANPILAPPEDNAELSDSIKVYIAKPETDMTLVGFLTVRVKNQSSVSVDALAEAMEKARAMGGSAIHVTAEGVKREMKAFGWGVGLSYTRANITASETGSGVAAGGLGISGGTAGYVDMPWLQIFVLK